MLHCPQTIREGAVAVKKGTIQLDQPSPATTMYSPMQGVVEPVTDHGDYSSEDASPLDRTSALENPNLPSVIDDDPHVASSRIETLPEAGSTTDQVEDSVAIHARAYQVEMFEKSLEQNIIVVMDTGSGKTQVAVLRIQAELEKSSDKIIWFLAPTSALCQQQFRVLKSQIGAAQIKLLGGADNYETWSDARIWDDYLKNVRVVVSTYQILLDAISHAFVHLGQLSLIVFDEAHNCVKKHPGNKIMERYKVCKSNGVPCPAILGLTASPIMKSNLKGISIIEQSLDAVCKTPTIHREELQCAVKRPTLAFVVVPIPGSPPPTKSMNDLASAYRNIDIYQDPYVLGLRDQATEKSKIMLGKILEKQDTFTMKQIKSMYNKATAIHKGLGPWAADYFLYEAVTQFLDSLNRNLTWFDTWDLEERRYTAKALQGVEVKPPQPFEKTGVLDTSAKFNALVQELQSAPDDIRCIIFVEETVTVFVLAHMLSATPSISNRFRVGTLIGTSSYAARKRDIGELNQVKGVQHLEDFRTGKLNLLVATSVAEEGIDVPACNLVVCWNSPPNVKSFIQRRGRARMENSRIILLLEDSSEQHQVWLELEGVMKRCIEDDTRVAHELEELEALDTNPNISPLIIASTGAQLDFDQAKSHLEHFCRKISSKQYIDSRPYYITEQIGSSSDGHPMMNASVQLPPSLPQAVRRVKGLGQWYSEKNAFKDAAFQAFKALYASGLVNDNLMPLFDDVPEGVETRSSVVEVNGLWKPWQKVAQLWEHRDEREQREVLLKDGNRVMAKFQASLPCHFPRIPPFSIYWDTENTWTVEISEHRHHVSACNLREDQSAALIDLAYGHRWLSEDLPHILHLRCTEQIGFRQHVGRWAAEESTLGPEFVVRNGVGRAHLFLEWLPCMPPPALVGKIENDNEDNLDDAPWLAVKNWPRRQDLLHPILQSPEPRNEPGKYTSKKYPHILPASHCTVDTIDRSKAYFGSIIPSVVHMLEIYLTAEELCRTTLKPVAISDNSLVVTAISSRAAGEATDYESFEFLGDSILKVLATVSVMIQRPHCPEGYLSAMRDHIVSNARLCRASVEKGLDRFILTNRFTGQKWRPLYIKDWVSADDKTSDKRNMSTKTLADVVESLVGAAFLDGGMEKALACLRVFLPEVEWYGLVDAHMRLAGGRNIVTQLHPDHEPLEDLIGYTFRNKALLMEALTHTSWGLRTSADMSMERLEFLGDTILDRVVVSALWAHEVQLSNKRMHLIRTACVNADLLGFLVMEWNTTQETTEISPTDLVTTVSQNPVPFWKYMRQRSAHVVDAQVATEERHAAERDAILDAIAHSPEYPWAKLAHLNIPKFMSDMFESLLGAVWVDSGSMEICAQIVERIGILPYLRRMLSDDFIVAHPKNKFGELAAKDLKIVRYETTVQMKDGVKDLICKVFVDEQLIVEVSGGVNPEEIVTKAADEAYHMLLVRGNDVSDEMMIE
ncbi:RNase3 domain-containing protein [Astrocystis sublimbata]|nr:RNase3 domain-containing protein [Astrocystis sublimbata]